MTTIILIIIGVLIAAAGALALMYYGGFGFQDSENKALATTLVSHGNQIDAAMTLYQAENGTNVVVQYQEEALNKLVENKNLGSIPRSPIASDVPNEWKYDAQRGIVRSAIGKADDERANKVCKEARKIYGLTGEPLSCDDPTITRSDPCCTMKQSDL